MQAYNAYLVGRGFVNARPPGRDVKAIEAFEEAIRLDESHAPPHAGPAIALSINNRDWENTRATIVRAATTAIDLDPELAEAHASLGLALFDHAIRLGNTRTELERADGSLWRALDLDPSLSIAYSWLEGVLGAQGRHGESSAVAEQGLLVDPLNPVLSYNIAMNLRWRGETERAEQLLLRLTYLPEPPWMAY
jgi:adenylate cyclase